MAKAIQGSRVFHIRVHPVLSVFIGFKKSSFAESAIHQILKRPPSPKADGRLTR
jgi:hypothetical protein